MANSRYKLNNAPQPVKRCSVCNCRIPLSSPYIKCKECMKNELFPQVKEYILNNYDVNELMVADEFGIDPSIVREWVKDGHLEYRKRPLP